MSSYMSKTIKTGQDNWEDSAYAIPITDANFRVGISFLYEALSVGAYSGTTNVVLPTSGSQDLTNNCVMDLRTGLMWWKAVSPVALLWDAHCDHLSWDNKASGTQFTVGNWLKGGTSNAVGVIRYLKNKESPAGEAHLELISGTFQNNETLTEYEPDGTPTGVTALVDGTLTEGDDEDIWDFLNRCNTAKLAGYSDWRIPTAKELMTLGQYFFATTRFVPDEAYFSSSIYNKVIWSSTSHPTLISHAYGMRMTDGAFHCYSDGSRHKALPDINLYAMLARGPILGNGRPCIPFRDGQIEQANGFFPDTGIFDPGNELDWTVKDTGQYASTTTINLPGRNETLDNKVCVENKSGLMWLYDSFDEVPYLDPGGSSVPYRDDAITCVQCANNQNLAGHSDWRMPNRKEIFSVMDIGINSGFLPSTYFKVPNSIAWLSDLSVTVPTTTQHVFYPGTVRGISTRTKNLLSQPARVILVRAGYHD